MVLASIHSTLRAFSKAAALFYSCIFFFFFFTILKSNPHPILLSTCRPWSRPLSDFAVDEFLALCEMFGGPAHPLGGAAAVAQARRRLKDGAGPACVQVELPSSVALAIGERLVSGTLYEVVCEASDAPMLHSKLCEDGRLQQADFKATARLTNGKAEGGDEVGDSSARLPHVLFLQYPGGSGGLRPVERMGAKRRKTVMKELLQDTWLDPAGNGALGCGPRGGKEKGNGKRKGGGKGTGKGEGQGKGTGKGPAILTAGSVDADGRAAADSHARGANSSDKQRLHLAVMLVPEVVPASGTHDSVELARCYLAKPLGIGIALQRVATLPPPPSATVGKITPLRPELAWILTNLAQVCAGSVVVDPFAGTGSLLFPSIALAALHVVALDIQESSPHARVSTGAIAADASLAADSVAVGGGGRNAAPTESGMERVRANAHHLPFRDVCSGTSSVKGSNVGGLFDACICDPPYGLRKPRMLTKGEKDSPVENAAEMQAAVAAAMYGSDQIQFYTIFVCFSFFKTRKHAVSRRRAPPSSVSSEVTRLPSNLC